MRTLTLDECYRENAENVRRIVASRITGDSDLADDACAFAWMQAARYWPITPNPVGWVVMVARRWAWAEAAKRRGADAELLDDVDADPLADPQRQAEAREALRAIGRLSDGQREALSGRMAGLSYAEIAAGAGQAYSWANRHVTEGRAALRAELGTDENEED